MVHVAKELLQILHKGPVVPLRLGVKNGVGIVWLKYRPSPEGLDES